MIFSTDKTHNRNTQNKSHKNKIISYSLIIKQSIWTTESCSHKGIFFFFFFWLMNWNFFYCCSTVYKQNTIKKSMYMWFNRKQTTTTTTAAFADNRSCCCFMSNVYFIYWIRTKKIWTEIIIIISNRNEKKESWKKREFLDWQKREIYTDDSVAQPIQVSSFQIQPIGSIVLQKKNSHFEIFDQDIFLFCFVLFLVLMIVATTRLLWSINEMFIFNHNDCFFFVTNDAVISRFN